MTIAEQRITALAQEAHTFAKEAHDKATSAESAVEQYILKHLPTLQNMIATWEATIPNIDKMIKEWNQFVDNRENVIESLITEWNDFRTKYLPVIEQHFSGTVAAVSGDAAAVMEKLENAGEAEAKQAVEETKTTAAENPEPVVETGIGQAMVDEAVAIGAGETHAAG